MGKSRNRRKAGKKHKHFRGGDAIRKKDEQPEMAMPTANAKIIHDLMKQKGVKGNFKDWVIIAGRRLVDWLGSHAIIGDEADDEKLEGMKLVRKDKLHKFIGAEWAAKFWDPKMRRRRMYGEHPRKPVRNAPNQR